MGLIMTLTKEWLIKYMRDTTGVQLQEARSVIEILFNEMANQLENGHEVMISGFGKWELRKKAPRKIRHPDTGAMIQIPSRCIVHFTPSKKLRLKLNPHTEREKK
jgi:integration host factor subunit alpha